MKSQVFKLSYYYDREGSRTVRCVQCNRRVAWSQSSLRHPIDEGYSNLFFFFLYLFFFVFLFLHSLRSRAQASIRMCTRVSKHVSCVVLLLKILRDYHFFQSIHPRLWGLEWGNRISIFSLAPPISTWWARDASESCSDNRW